MTTPQVGHFPLIALRPFFMSLLNGIGDLLFRFAFYAISFWHMDSSEYADATA
jgi:hypothetical protein